MELKTQSSVHTSTSTSQTTPSQPVTRYIPFPGAELRGEQSEYEVRPKSLEALLEADKRA